METVTNEGLAQGAFGQAESYFQSAFILFFHATQFFCQHSQFLFPSFVCEAFSLELFLKALILVEGSEYKPTHDLEKLFNQLSTESKTIIKSQTELRFAQMNVQRIRVQQYMEQTKGVPLTQAETIQPLDFDSALHSSRAAFEAIRYIHETPTGDPERINWTGQPILHATRERILALKPAWRNVKFSHEPQAPSSVPPIP